MKVIALFTDRGLLLFLLISSINVIDYEKGRANNEL